MTPDWHDNDNGVPEAELQAYVDGELDPRRRSAVEAYLATNAREAARLAAYRAQNVALHALFDPLRERDKNPIPPAMAALARRLDAQLAAEPSAGRRRPYRPGARAAAVALMIGAAAAGGLALQQGGWHHDPLVSFTRQAASESAPPAPLQLASTAAEDDGAAAPDTADGPQQVANWLAAQPGEPPTRLPDLEALGFELVAQRLIETRGGRPAAQLLYQNDEGQRVTLLMRAGGAAGKTTFTFTRDGQSAQFFWQDSHRAYSLFGRLDQDELLEIAEAVSRSFNDAAEEPAKPEPAAPAAALESAVQSQGDAPGVPQDDSAQPEAPLPLPEQLKEIPKET